MAESLSWNIQFFWKELLKEGLLNNSMKQQGKDGDETE